jgi:hypothetical protein
MKPTAATGLLLMLATSASAQLSLLPQIGMERSRTTVNYNQLGNFAPVGVKTGLSASLRVDYRFKTGHGPFAGIATSPGIMELTFAQPSAALSGIKRNGPIQLRLEGGYQYTSRPIHFRSGSAKSSGQSRANRNSFGCGAEKKSFRQPSINVRIQPSLAFAWLPMAGSRLNVKTDSYVYRAGNYSKAIIPGLAFEFGRGRERLVNVGFYYTSPIGNNEVTRITNIENGKPITTTFSSGQASWAVRVGLPVKLGAHNKPVAHKQQQKKQCTYRCGSYRYHCIQKL